MKGEPKRMLRLGPTPASSDEISRAGRLTRKSAEVPRIKTPVGRSADGEIIIRRTVHYPAGTSLAALLISFHMIGLDCESAASASPEDQNKISSGLCFASARICGSMNLAMSAQRFVGGLGAVAPETAAFFDKECKACAVCESCKGFICRILG